ncbi:hypothetical protein E4U27_001216 [Claviceps purpurea]|nr:hypothetical protein E4U27_001216 [Claviceps purpurea]
MSGCSAELYGGIPHDGDQIVVNFRAATRDYLQELVIARTGQCRTVDLAFTLIYEGRVSQKQPIAAYGEARCYSSG